jgi:hypothetical protein
MKAKTKNELEKNKTGKKRVFFLIIEKLVYHVYCVLGYIIRGFSKEGFSNAWCGLCSEVLRRQIRKTP